MHPLRVNRLLSFHQEPSTYVKKKKKKKVASRFVLTRSLCAVAQLTASLILYDRKLYWSMIVYWVKERA